MKALHLLKSDRETQGLLTETERNALSAIVVERCIDSFFFFARHVLDFDLLVENPHERWADNFQAAIKSNRKKIMRLKARGTFKSTIYGIAFILWVWGVYSPQIRIFYTSANSLLLNEVSDKINQFIGTDKGDTLYSSIFGITKDSNAKNTSDVFNIKGRSGKGFSLILRTAGGSTVGIHPNIVIADDPLDQNDRDSEATRLQKERWFDTLTPLLVPYITNIENVVFESIYYIGTVWHFKDLTYHIQERNKTLAPSNKWDIEIESIVDERGNPSYPEFFPASKIAEIKANISEIFWSCQYLNCALPEGMQTFNLKRIHFIRPDQFKEIMPLGQILCVFDPSLGKTHSDFPAVWWLHFWNDTITFFDAIDTKVELSLIVHQIAARNKEYKCRKMVYEDNNVTLVKEALLKAHKRINYAIVVDSVHHSSNKEERIVSVQPEVYSGATQFMSDYEVRYPEAMNQIVFYGAYGNDDFPDAMQIGIEYFRQPHFEFRRYAEML